jgi:hypothetical protein
VDGKLREILRWGVPELGGTGGAKGLPTSFLATVLLSAQDEVSAVLQNSLQDDLSGSGKEQIAAALQAVAQDPLFVALLRETQARRDAAYTFRMYGMPFVALVIDAFRRISIYDSAEEPGNRP